MISGGKVHDMKERMTLEGGAEEKNNSGERRMRSRRKIKENLGGGK